MITENQHRNLYTANWNLCTANKNICTSNWDMTPAPWSLFTANRIIATKSSTFQYIFFKTLHKSHSLQWTVHCTQYRTPNKGLHCSCCRCDVWWHSAESCHLPSSLHLTECRVFSDSFEANGLAGTPHCWTDSCGLFCVFLCFRSFLGASFNKYVIQFVFFFSH